VRFPIGQRRLRQSLALVLLSSLFPILFPVPALASPVYSFTNAGATGNAGPTQAQVTSAYTSTTLAGAVTVNTQGIQEWIVPATGNYRIKVVGAHGAPATSGNSARRGGRGAIVEGERSLTSGTKLLIIVGQGGTGTTQHGGGGGASIVALTARTASLNPSDVVIAGGGGGLRQDSSVDGGNASTETYGTTTSSYSSSSTPATSNNTTTTMNGGTATTGYGGRAGEPSCFGDGGSGWLGDGQDDSSGSTTAKALTGTAAGGIGGSANGGFGGGGSGQGCNGGGGGGGYTGGNGGYIAGGGGTYVNGLSSVTKSVDSTRSYTTSSGAIHGYVTITSLGPSVSSFSPTSTLTNSGTLNYDLVFTQSVTGLISADFSLSGTGSSTCSIGSPSGSDATYQIQLTGCSPGSVILALRPNSIVNSSSQTGPPDTSTANTVTIDQTAPTISRVDSPTAGTYSPTGAPRGPNMDFSVRMSESVTVSTASGTPRLTLTVGTSTQYARYLSQSDSTTLTFRYTIDTSLTQVDTNGVTMASSLDLNGGSISDYASNTLTNTTITPPTLTSVLVAQRASAPTITFITPGDTRLSVAFTAGADNGSTITNYRYSLNGGSSIALSPADTITPVVITGLTNGTGYSVRLIPITAVGDGDTSTAVTETPTAITVGAGSNISTSYGRIDTSTAFTASGGTSPYTFSLSPTVSGISINSSSGQVTTSATLAVGSYSSNVVATDSASRTGNKSITVTVTKATPTFSAWSNVTKNFGNSPYTIAPPSVTGSLAGTLNYTSSNPSVISISGSTATVVGAGSATITALFTPTDSSNYETATTTNTVTVNKASQTITFGALSNRTMGTGTFLLSSSDTSSSGLALAYSSATLATCTLSGADSRTVTLVSAGTCTISANQAGNSNYDSATTVSRSFTISSALLITTPSGASLSATYNSAYTLTLSSSGGSGGNVFTLTTGSLPAGLSLNASSGEISGTPSTAGNYAIIITVTDSNSATASTSSFSIAVARLTPTISLALAGAVTSTPIGVAIVITATVSQNGAVTFKAGGSTISGCSSVSSSGGSATCSWTPSALGSASLTGDLVPTDSTNYANATSATLNVTVVSGSTTIEISFSSSISKGKTITITASTTNIAGKVTFQVNRRDIKGCVNRNVSAGAATCSWKVALHGSQTVTANFNPTNNAYNSSSTSQNVLAARRTSR
jgi:Putative Ig domain/Glycine rich protein